MPLGFLESSSDWAQPWFFVGLGMGLSVTFIEPYFGTPRAAIINGAGVVGACATADAGTVGELWVLLAICAGVVSCAGILAAITRDGVANTVSRQFAARFGRAAPLGAAVLVLIVVTDAAAQREGFEALAVGSAVLVFAISFDWIGVWQRVVRSENSATAVAAIGPRMLLVVGAGNDLRPGDMVIVDAGGDARCSGNVLGRMPHPDGLRYRIALTSEWTAVSRGFPQSLILRKAGEVTRAVGAVGDGTTQQVVAFEPFSRLSIGDPLTIGASERQLLYQVARLRLITSAWSGSQAVVPHATAHLLGRSDGTHLRATSHLPDPHDLVHEAGHLEGTLDEAFYELGHVKRTRIPIGIRIDDERRGHIAVLGMSGMGKTALAQRICRVLGADHVVVALDTTGEYETRLRFPLWADGDFGSTGHFVHQPPGDPPDQAASFIDRCMRAGVEEYRTGIRPKGRIVMLEEAHTFLPEWNVALRAQQERVAYSTRLIMQARKFGVTFIVVSQRTAVVSKSALSQCENYIIFKTLDHTGLEYLESLVGREMRDAIPNLERYEAMCVGPAFNADAPVIITVGPP